MTAESEGRKFNYFFGLINFIAVFVIVWFLWYIFMNQDTVLKLYTPMYGFSLVVVFLSTIILMTKVVDYPAVFDRHSKYRNPVAKGIILTVIAFFAMAILYYVVFRGLLGGFGIAYFSPDSIVAGGGIGAEPYVARENASTAVVYYFAAFLWMALFWDLGFGRWPWQNDSHAVQVASKIFAIVFFVNLFYVLLFHPHVCYLFYPAQTKAGVSPWWEQMAGTGSAFFSLGLVLSWLVWIVFSELLWEGRPWHLFDNKDGTGSFARGFMVFISTMTLGIILLWVLLQIFIAVWYEPFVGGQYTDGTDWRYIHAGEIGGFFILGAFILKIYFNNFPNLNNVWGRCILRSIIAAAIGMLGYWFYYSPLATFFLSKVQGFAQPGDTPLVWTLLFLSIVLIHDEFFEGWPLRHSVGSREEKAPSFSQELAHQAHR